MHIGNILAAWRLHIYCTFAAYSLHIGCVVTAPEWHITGTLAAPSQHISCILAAHSWHIICTCTTHWPYSAHVDIAYWMRTCCTNTRAMCQQSASRRGDVTTPTQCLTDLTPWIHNLCAHMWVRPKAHLNQK